MAWPEGCAVCESIDEPRMNKLPRHANSLSLSLRQFAFESLRLFDGAPGPNETVLTYDTSHENSLLEMGCKQCPTL